MLSRVNQMEAAVVDMETTAMFKAKLVEIFSVMKPGMQFRYEPELDAFIEFLVWRFSIWVDKPTPGNALMNLKYRGERGAVITRKITEDVGGPGLTVNQKLLYYIATVGGKYIWARLRSFFAFRRWGDLEQRSLPRFAWFCLQRIVGIYKAVSLGNLLIFLCTGKYRNLIERVLRVRLVSESPDTNLWVGIEDNDFQSAWSLQDEDMQSLLLPLLDTPLMNNILHSFSKVLSPDSAGKPVLCPICGSNPTISVVALPCQHRYCYYCLQTRWSAAPSFHCVKCNKPVAAMQRYVGSQLPHFDYFKNRRSER